jgi:phage baseplate assembly protein gpV
MATPRGDDLEEIVTRLVQRVEGRHFGKYRGIVSDNEDPQGIGRIRARVPQLLGDVELGWALPCLPYGGTSEQGLFLVPEPDASVWIEFEGGDLAYPVWTGTWWGSGEVPESATPAQKVLKTSTGHAIVLDDDAGSITVTDANANTVTMDASGIVLADANGNTVTMDADGITLAGSTISVGDPASDNLVGFNQLNAALQQLVTLLGTHTHSSTAPGAPTSPPMVPLTLSLDAAKSPHKVEL